MEESLPVESQLNDNYLVVVNVEPVDVEMGGSARSEGATATGCLERSQPDAEDDGSCDPDDQSATAGTSDNNSSRWDFKWTEKGTRLLINLLMKCKDDFVDGKMKKKKMWASIAKQLCEAGFQCTDIQASNKWKLLARSYRGSVTRMSAQKHTQKKTMPGIVERRYFKELTELMGNGGSERRRAGADSPRGSCQRTEQQQQVLVDNWSTSATSDHDNMAAPPPIIFESHRRKCSHDVLADLVQWIRDSEERQMQMMQKLHYEKMAFLKDLLQHIKGPTHGHHC